MSALTEPDDLQTQKPGAHGAQPSGDLTEVFDLRITVDRIDGRSVCGLAVGDYFEVSDSSWLRIPTGKHFCYFALASAMPLLAAKQRRMPPGDWLEQDCLVACPDPEERLVMRIDRVGSVQLPTSDLT